MRRTDRSSWPDSGERRPLALRPLLALATVKLLLWAAVGGRYGFHRDELYYLVGGRHLDLGYVDHPLLVPWLARISESLFGLSLMPLRLLSTLASAAVVGGAGALAARLGGGRRAQLLAGLAVLVCPFFLMTQNLFQTVPFDQLVWTAALLALAGLLATGVGRRWLLFGLVTGIGLLTKYTVLALGAGVVVGLLLTPHRRQLSRPWIWLGGALALAVSLPSWIWQLRHDWATLEFMANNHAAETFPPPAFIGLQAVFAGPFALPLMAFGFLFLFSRRNRQFRPLGWTAAAVLLFFLAGQSKPYYAAPLYPLLFAAGAVWLEPRLEAARGWRRHWVPAILAGNLLLLPVFSPVLPVGGYARLHDGFPHQEFGETVGWPELVDTVGGALAQLPEETRNGVALVTSNYGSAAALDLWGGAHGLPPAACGQNSYYYWRWPTSIDPAIVVGFSSETVERYYDQVDRLAVVSNRYGIANEELGRPVLLARGARLSAPELRQRLRVFR